MTTLTIYIIISFWFTSLTIILITIPSVFLPQQADARCPNGYHKSPSGDCEQVVPHKGKLLRCPNGFHQSPDGFHQSPDGDCERVANDNNGGSSNSNEDQNGIPSEDDEGASSNGFSSSSNTTSPEPLSSSSVTVSESTPGKCNDSLWNHVYNASRLEIVDTCITLTGVIDSIRSERDGDLHIRLRLDPPMRI